MEKIHATQEWVNEQLNDIGLSEDITNLKIYGTTDVYTLTEDDVWIVSNHIISQKKDETISHDVIIIPEGITKINTDVYNDSFNLNLEAKKIVLPSTFDEIRMNRNSDEANPNSHTLNGELILNEKISIIDVEDDYAYDNFIKKIVVNSSLQELRFYSGYGTDIIIPKDINIRVKINFGYCFDANLYVYNPFFNFSNVSVGDYGAENGGTIYSYAGSTAEAFAKEHNIHFVNIGSDCSIPIHNLEETEITIQPNEFYSFTGTESLTIYLGETSENQLDEFMFSFDTPDSITDAFLYIISDQEIKWIKEPNIKPNYIYEVSIVNNVGVIAGFPKEVA